MKNFVFATIVALILVSISTANAAEYSYDAWYGDEDYGDYYIPDYSYPSSDGFEYQGHDPEVEGWSSYYGDFNASVVHWQGSLTPADGNHFMSVTTDEEMSIVGKTFNGNAGDVFYLFWAAEYTDYAPFVDSVFGYIEDAAGNTKGLFSSVLTDGSSNWWNYASETLDVTGQFTLFLGVQNAIDTAFSPTLMVDAIGSFTPYYGEKGTAPVPVPPAIWMFASAVGALVVRRRK